MFALRTTLYGFFVLNCNVVFGQVTNSLDFTYSGKGGFIIAHRPFMQHLVQKNTWAHELAIGCAINTNSEAAKVYNNLNHGISFGFRNFGYNTVLGLAADITFYNQFQVFQTRNNFCLDIKAYTGVGWLTKKYDEVLNPKNNAIGSHFNAQAGLQFNFSKYVFHHKFSLGWEFNHYSNGAITNPNLGLNSLGLILGYGYQFQARPISHKKANKTYLLENKWEYFLTGIITLKEIGEIPFPAKKYPIGAVTIGVGFRPHYKISYEGGLDFVYNEANFHKYADTTFIRSDIPQVGFFGGVGIHLDRSVIAINYGYYLFDKIDAEGKLYNRIGYRFYPKKSFYLAFAIKANFAKAEYFEFGIGYSLKR